MKKTAIFLILVIVSLFVFYDQLANWVEHVSVKNKDCFWAPVALYKLAGFSMAVFKRIDFTKPMQQVHMVLARSIVFGENSSRVAAVLKI